MAPHPFRIRFPKASTFFILGCCLFLFCNIAWSLEMTREQIYQIATVSAREGKYDQAAEFFKKLIEVDPRFAPAYNGLGLVYESWDGGDIKEAVRYFRLATEIDPNYMESWNNLGRTCYGMGSFGEAEKALLKSLALKADQPDVELALAWVYLLGQSKGEDAAKHFEKALAVTENPMAHYGLGLAYLLEGNKFKVLEQITALRRFQKEEQAAGLEKMVREGIKLTSTPGMPLVTGLDQGESAFQKELSALSDGGVDVNKDNNGIKVRLKGPLR